MKRRYLSRRNQRGASLLEFTLVGIPLVFVLISIFELSRVMWVYHTLSSAAKEGVRFAQVHGANCVNGPSIPNNCTRTMADIAQQIQLWGTGLDPSTTTLTFSTSVGGSSQSCSLNGCPATVWPPAGANDIGRLIRIDISMPVPNAIALFWPGAGPGQTFGSFTLGASSTGLIQF